MGVSVKRLGVVALGFAAVSMIATPGGAQEKSKRGREVLNGFEAAAGEVIVRLTNAPDSALTDYLGSTLDADDLKQLGKIHGGHFLRLHSRSLDVSSMIARLSAFAEIEYAEPNYTVRTTAAPNDPSFASQWAFRNLGQVINGKSGSTGADVGTVSAWDLTKGSTANVVAVLDTGVDYAHTDLSTNVWTAPARFTVTINGQPISCASGTRGFNTITNLCTALDDVGHGSHVAGIIGAIGNNGTGVTGVNQVARMLPIKVIDSSGYGTTADAIEGIKFAIQVKQAFAATGAANVRVINASWGGAAFSQALLDAIGEADANNILFVAAAGNSGLNNDAQPFYPASYAAPNIVAVAASDSSDYLAGFSNYGAQTVHMAAPGDNIYSTVPGSTYMFASGTSMAAPMVSGAAALVLSICKTLNTAGLKNDLLTTVTPLGSLVGRVSTGGRLNVNAAVRTCAPPAPPAWPTGVTVQASPQQVVVSWNPSAGATSYNVKKATSSRGPWVTVSTTATTSATVTGLANGATFYFVVSAQNAGGESANTSAVLATPLAPPPAPTGLKAIGQVGQVYLSWSAATGAIGYNVQRSAVVGGPFVKIASTTSRAYYDKSLTKGATYCYVVTAYNKNNTEGPSSNPVCAIVQ